MDFHLVGFLAQNFVIMTVVNRMLGGAFITGTDVGFLNMMGLSRKLNLGLFTVPVPNLDFLNGLYHLVRWDYSFFGGNAQIIQYLLYSFTFAVAVICFFTILGLLYNYFGRVR